MRLERDALFRDLANLAEAHHLEAAGVGQDRSIPAHEFVQPAEARDAFRAGAQHQMIGVAEEDVGTGVAHLIGIERLDRRDRSDRHERRRANGPARRSDLAEPRKAVCRFEMEGEAPVGSKFLFHVCL